MPPPLAPVLRLVFLMILFRLGIAALRPAFSSAPAVPKFPTKALLSAVRLSCSSPPLPAPLPPRSRRPSLLDVTSNVPQRSASSALSFIASLLKAHHGPDTAWSCKLDGARTRAGSCHYGKKLVTLSRSFALLAPDAEFKNIVYHEVAHSLTPPIQSAKKGGLRSGKLATSASLALETLPPSILLQQALSTLSFTSPTSYNPSVSPLPSSSRSKPHSEAWRAVFLALGGDGSRCHSVRFTAPRYTLTCVSGCFEVGRDRVSKRLGGLDAVRERGKEEGGDERGPKKTNKRGRKIKPKCCCKYCGGAFLYITSSTMQNVKL